MPRRRLCLGFYVCELEFGEREIENLVFVKFVVYLFEWNNPRGRKRQTPKGGRRLAHHTPLLKIPVCVCVVAACRPPIPKERKKTDNPREGWEDGTPPPHRDFRGEVCSAVFFL